MESSMSMSDSMMGTMTMSGAPTDTMSMTMPMSTSMDGHMDMSSMGGMMMGMESMAMVFFTSTSTPLYSWAWTPTTTGQYAGTCIFLITLATIFRGLLAVRIHLFPILALIQRRRGGPAMYETAVETKATSRPWRAREAVIVAAMDVVLVGVSYLLMLAVMTMNVGYFLSILAGVFVGSMVFGHYVANSAAH